MNNNIKKSFRAGLLLAAGAVAISSCTDTWDEHYNSVASIGFNGTTMQAIEQNAPDFAKVVKAYGYDRELNSDNVYTVWAPADGSFNVSDYVDANGKMIADSADVVKQFIKNHVARYALSYSNDSTSITLINQKRGSMSADGKFGGVAMTKTNLSCKNGVLHIVEKAVPYSFNLFELVAKHYKDDQTPGKDTMSLYQFLYDPTVNSDSLIENKSVSSGVDENGDKIWVDSFVMRNNTVLKNVDAKIYEEDSSYIAILPSAKAWAERRKIAESLLKFNPVEDDRAEGACDSLMRHYSNRFAMADLFYNKNANEHWMDSLKSTIYGTDWRYNVYYSKVPKTMPEGKEVNDILAKCGEKINCSNGDGYFVDEYPMSIYEQFFKTIRLTRLRNNIDMTLDSKGNAEFTKNVNTAFRQYSGTVRKYLTDPVDSTALINPKDFNYNYIDVVPSTSSANISIAFQIPHTLSGTYDMYLVTCPIWMSQENLAVDKMDERPYRFYTYVIERNDAGKEIGLYPSSGNRLSNPDGSGNYFVTKGLAYDEEGYPIVNDTTYLGEYTFKNAYYGRNEEGVLIQFQSQVTSKLASTYSREMLISALILKPHDDSKGPVVVPQVTEAKAIKDSNNFSLKNE